MTTAHGVATDAAGLLTDYRPGSSFFFSSPERTLLAQGTWADVPAAPHAPRTLPGRAASALGTAARSGHRDPIVVGALPFRPDAPARLFVPATVQRTGPATGAPPARFGHDHKPPPVPRVTIRSLPEPAEYERAVAKALGRLAGGGLQKVVLARALHLTAAGRVDAARLLRNLAAGDPHGHLYAVTVAGHPGNRTLLGASPELLVSRRGSEVVSHPLAGSAARSADPAEDERRAAALLESAKDLHEHALVVDAVARALRPYCPRLDVPSRPALVRTDTMWHLGTRVTGRLADPRVTALDLAVALHPTPAVCGTPAPAARAVIAELEPFDRGFYGGAVGWCDASGDGEWAVTIRCAEAQGRVLRLFAGAGIVPGSEPAGELAETAAKFRTLLRALGLDDAGDMEATA
ncbi:MULTISPECIES: isochorismate synthase DhbC [Thermomonosporaceae]|uniref:isochorismate synthase DhbC n=1 Tax=Thermomonosporaceae TaxID=2012 RepID=UPI00255A7C4F|nr:MULTISPECIES: isochorismate synthase DhbC [Thermomonosporaceae]MDL4770559.1 isochorismate synthase DhbC [Actinomadura xylanilytica]